MAATSGRDFTISKGATVIAGMRETGLSLDGSPVDITSKTDSGFRTMGTFAGVRSFDLTASGVLLDAVIQDLALAHAGGLLLTDVTIDFADGANISGNVYLASATFTGAHDGENTYEVSLQSSGAWVYTAAA